ncbi:MAG: 4Fe-4S binding protein [Magnetococcales bacterium]|nr:4Fe-4S binding protein [Magnetococcales bacterium]
MVQSLMLGITVYGGLLVGPYLSNKISDALPALSCAFDQENGAYCVLIPFQHQFHHRIGETFVRIGELTLSMFMPLLFTFLTFYIFFIFLNKAFCGWVCPLGTVQELLYRLGRRMNLTIHRLGEDKINRVRPIKWIILLFLVFLLPLLTGLGITPHAAGDAYCQVCPSRIVTTLLTANTEQVAVSSASWLEFTFGAIRNLMIGFIIIAAMTIRQPFCRICPMLAFHAIFRRFSFLRLDKKEHAKCGRCDLCVKSCPMDIPEISNKHGSAAFNEDCTMCGRCVEFCPDNGVISLRFGPVALFKSSTDYFRRRSRQEKPDGTIKKMVAAKNSEKADG